MLGLEQRAAHGRQSGHGSGTRSLAATPQSESRTASLCKHAHTRTHGHMQPHQNKHGVAATNLSKDIINATIKQAIKNEGKLSDTDAIFVTSTIWKLRNNAVKKKAQDALKKERDHLGPDLCTGTAPSWKRRERRGIRV